MIPLLHDVCQILAVIYQFCPQHRAVGADPLIGNASIVQVLPDFLHYLFHGLQGPQVSLVEHHVQRLAAIGMVEQEIEIVLG